MKNFLNVRNFGIPEPAPIPKEPTIAQIVQIGLEYEELKADAERIQKELAKRNAFLKKMLLDIPDMRIPVNGRDLGLVLYPNEEFDLEAAKKKKDLVGKLKPFIQKIEKFDLNAAKKSLGLKALEKFISVEQAYQLRFLKSTADVQSNEREGDENE